jgi:hypothetical protein
MRALALTSAGLRYTAVLILAVFHLSPGPYPGDNIIAIAAALKQDLAARALDLSIRAEEIARLHEAPEILRMNISRYRSMLAAGIDDEQKKRIVQEMLTDAEEVLAQVTGKP